MASIDPSSAPAGHVLERLRSEHHIWLTTLSGSGAPQPGPVWFLWRDDSVLIFSHPETLKVRAIRRDSHVSLNLNSNATGGDVGIFDATLDDGGLRADEVPASTRAARCRERGCHPIAERMSRLLVAAGARLNAWAAPSHRQVHLELGRESMPTSVS
jgi:PPOX class probable F420-dependent enzyme